MARNSKQGAAKPAHEFNNEALKAAGASLDARAAVLAPIDAMFGGLVEYQRDRVVSEAAFFINQGSESFFEAGKRLILLKEHEQHGEFLKALDGIGIDDRAARKLMQVSARFGDMKSLGALPRSKLLELAILDDEDLAELEKGGTASGLTFDEVDKMGVRELRNALRKEREERVEEAEQNERLIAAKDKKLNQLSKKATVEPWDKRIAGLVDELHTCSLASSECLTRVYQVAEATAVAKLENDDGMHQQQELAGRVINDVNLLVQKVAAIQAFVYENFMQYVEGATPVLTDVTEPTRGKKG
jgi:hypothetical protein